MVSISEAINKSLSVCSDRILLFPVFSFTCYSESERGAIDGQCKGEGCEGRRDHFVIDRKINLMHDVT